MNKLEQQSYFLSNLKQVLKYNPNATIEQIREYIYSELIRINTKKSEKDIDLINNFSNWDTYFKSISGINNFYDLRWQSFYQFKNKENYLDTRTAIKIYIPMDANHINEGVKQLFTYIAIEDIANVSKVRRKVTLDNVVVRVKSIEDAEKILNYVKNNQYIQEGLIKPNPFLIDKDNIALAIDGNTTSYNGVLSELIAEYAYKRNDNLDSINLFDFRNYLEKMDSDYKTYIGNPNHEYSNIIKLALKIVNNISTYEEFKSYALTRKENIQKESIDNKYILDNALYKMINKYGSQITKRHLKEYINTGRITLFTRDNNVRQNVKLYLNQDIVKKIVESTIHGDDYDSYIDYLIGINNRNVQMSNDDSISFSK